MANPTQAVISAHKRALRRKISSTLNQLSSTDVEDQSRGIAERVLSLRYFHSCKNVSCYLNMPTGEVRTTMIVESILNSGKTLFVPRIQKNDGMMEFFRIYSLDDLASLTSGTWGIREPDEFWEGQKRSTILGSPEQSLDLILLPGVAFDRTLSRLGHGKGYYDRFISNYLSSGRKKPLLVGVGLREQVLDDEIVPITENDWKLDILITPEEVIEAVQTV